MRCHQLPDLFRFGQLFAGFILESHKFPPATTRTAWHERRAALVVTHLLSQCGHRGVIAEWEDVHHQPVEEVPEVVPRNVESCPHGTLGPIRSNNESGA